MSVASFHSFIETLDEPSSMLSPALMAAAMRISESDLADLAGVDPAMLIETPHSKNLQSALRDLGRVLQAAYRMNTDQERVLHWFFNHPITDFDGQTPALLVTKGETNVVIDYIASIAGGATG